MSDFVHYAVPAAVIDDGNRQLHVSLGEVGGLDLVQLAVTNVANSVDVVLTLDEVRDLVKVLQGIDPEHQPATGGYYLYRVEIVKYPEGAWTFEEVYGEEYSWINEDWQPEGWDPGEEWVARYGTKFFWPSTKREYRSKSSARDRAKLIESFGATAVVVRSSLITWDEPNAGVESKTRSK